MEDFEISDGSDDLFTGFTDVDTETDNVEDTSTDENKTDTDIIADVDVNNLFDTQDGVSTEDEDTQEQDSTSLEDEPNSPNLFSSLASALQEDGILDLGTTDMSKITNAEEFASAVEAHITSKLDVTQKRIKEALDAEVATDDIRTFEQTITYLESIDDAKLTEESDAGELLRTQIIYQDYINKGFSEEIASKKVKRSVDAGTDIEDAQEALVSNKEHFTKEYKDIVATNKSVIDKEQAVIKQQAATLKSQILDTEEPFAGVKLDKNTRTKIYATLMNPVHKDEDGKMLTAIQQFEKEHPIDFKQKLATIFVLTNGFKDLDPIVKNKVIKETKKGVRELEHILANTPVTSRGTLNLANSANDKESFLGRNMVLDL